MRVTNNGAIRVLIAYTAISIFAKVAFVSAAALFLLAFYQQSMFIKEWREDHAPAVSWFERGILSTAASFYPFLSERCRRRRRKLAIALCGAFLLAPFAVFLQRLVE